MSIRYPDSVGIAFASRPMAKLGLMVEPGKFGYIEKCPWCPATNIARQSKVQLTCGSIPCREKQNKATSKKRREREAAKKARRV